MKWLEIKDKNDLLPSLPMRGEWIEIFRLLEGGKGAWSLPMRGEWIEIPSFLSLERVLAMSLPMRGEWIEMLAGNDPQPVSPVSPHAGRVD